MCFEWATIFHRTQLNGFELDLDLRFQSCVIFIQKSLILSQNGIAFEMHQFEMKNRRKCYFKCGLFMNEFAKISTVGKRIGTCIHTRTANERQNMQKWWENTHKIQHQNDESKTIDWKRENGWKKTSSQFLQNIHFISFVIVFCRFWIRKTSILSILFAGANCLICVLKEKAKNRENKRKHNNGKGTLPFQIAAGYEHILELLGNSHFQRTWNLVSS